MGYRKFLKGSKGENSRFMTRNEAIKKLQVSLKVFRKLCIIKGIHPRNPKKKLKGHNKTYYYSKDIRYLQHERIIDIIRERKSNKTKATKLKAKGEWKALEALNQRNPGLDLDHIVKERYPTFKDALKDLDDCLSLIHLFASLDSSPEIKDYHIILCERLAREFQYYVMKSKSLKKVFVSIKGVYYQVEIQGETITWLAPMKYVNKKEKNVDYGVMMNFLEFYETLMKFVNYRLFTSIGLEYPLVYDNAKLNKDEGFASVIEKPLKAAQEKKEEANPTGLTRAQARKEKQKISKKELEFIKKLETKLSKSTQQEEEEESPSTAATTTEEPLIEEGGNLELNEQGISKDFEGLIKSDEIESNSIAKIIDTKNLFKGFLFYLNRETPKTMLEFVITSFGGQVCWEGGLYSESDQKITHQVVDRKSDYAGALYPTREYIQPQWVFDAVNVGIVLPYQEYRPDVVPPAHLSPFVIYDEASYIPQRKAALDALINQKDFDSRQVEESEDEDMGDAQDEDEDDDDEDEDNDNLLRIENKYLSELKSENQKKSNEDEEDEDEDEDEEDEEEEENVKMEVEQPKILTKKQREEEKRKAKEAEELKLAEVMIKKKDKWLYNRIKDTNQKKAESVQSLEKKRKLIETGFDVNSKPRDQTDYQPKDPKVLTQPPKNTKKPQQNNNNNNNKNNNNKKMNSSKQQPSKKLKTSK